MTQRVRHVPFLLAPEKHGIWHLRLAFDQDGTKAVRKHFNLTNEYKYRYWFRGADGDIERLPVVLPRTLAYLSALAPGAPRDTPPRTRDFGIAPARIRRMRAVFSEVAQPPKKLTPEKKKALTPARKAFLDGRLDQCAMVPDVDLTTKIAYAHHASGSFFQVSEAATEDTATVSVVSPDKAPLEAIQKIYSALRLSHTSELTKLFSPEDALLEIYLPVARISDLAGVFKQRFLLNAWHQALSESAEGRHVHAIRGVGIGTEELIVSIFETLARDRAPAGPLGQLLTLLDQRVGHILGKPEPGPQELDFSELVRLSGEFVKSEKQSATPNEALVALVIQLQKVLLPGVSTLAKHIAQVERRYPEEVKSRLFPRSVQRALEELVELRNRVSHRNERGQSVALIGPIDTAVALRAFSVVAGWWEEERARLDYAKSPKAIVSEIAERSRLRNDTAARGG